MNHQKRKLKRQLRRRLHVRRTITGTSERPRLTVFRSSKHIYAQLIDDVDGVTLASASSLAPDLRKDLPYGGNVKAAKVVGQKLAEAAKGKGIDKAAFDRGHYKFHGRVKALAEAANAAGLLCCEPKERKKAKLAAMAAAAPAKAAKADKGEKAAAAPKEKKEKKEKKEQPKAE
jgi:large subunit ribosomal protein L18